jgi:hypothetical protein
MTTTFLLIALVILITRLPYLRCDGPQPVRGVAIATVVQVLALLILALRPSVGLAMLALVVIGANVGGAVWERRTPHHVYLPRMVALAILLTVSAIATGPLGALASVRCCPQLTDPNRLLLLMLIGAIAVVGEANTVIRLVLQSADVIPRRVTMNALVPGTPIDHSEYNTGRLIGVLERLILYMLVLAGQFTAIGFILAAKGLVRYRALEDRTFAEYFLVGTLLSVLAAMLVALAVRALL